MTQRKLLELLSDGQFHSGQHLGDHIGISRTGVWKQIKALEELGLEVYSIRGRGYRIPGGVDLIELQHFVDQLPVDVAKMFDEQELHLQTGSTNELALNALRKGVNRGIYIAEQQTEGRGRRGRRWVSPFASGVYFSLAWRFRCGVNELEGLSLVVGLAVKRVLDRADVKNVNVKWPNDLLINGSKLAGVLIEVQGDTSIESQLVIGVGINAFISQGMAEAIDQPWADIKQQGIELSRTDLLAQVVIELVDILKKFEAQGFAVFRDEWMAGDIFYQQPVKVQTGADAFIAGIAKGVSETGALLLETEQGLRNIHGGEVSLRGLSSQGL